MGPGGNEGAPPPPPLAPSPPPRAPGPQAALGTGREEEGSWDLINFVKKVTRRCFFSPSLPPASPSLPPAFPSLEPLDGCVSTDSELIKSYLSSVVDTEPSGLACSGMREFLRVCRKWFAQTLVCAHPAPTRFLSCDPTPPPTHSTIGPAQPGWEPRPGRAGAGGGGQRVAGAAWWWLLISSRLLPCSWVPSTGRSGQKESGEVIITCLSFSRDV